MNVLNAPAVTNEAIGKQLEQKVVNKIPTVLLITVTEKKLYVRTCLQDVQLKKGASLLYYNSLFSLIFKHSKSPISRRLGSFFVLVLSVALIMPRNPNQ